MVNAGVDLTRRQLGGGGLTIELKLNRKKTKNWIPTGGVRPP